MYPDLSYFFHDLFGTPVDNWASLFQTFGLFLALSFLAAGIVCAKMMQEKEAQGILQPIPTKITIGEAPNMLELLVNIFLGFALGFALNNFATYQRILAVSPEKGFGSIVGELILGGKGNFLGGIIGALVLGGFYYWEKNKDKLPVPQEKIVNMLPSNRTPDIIFMAAISGIFGARLFSILENVPGFLENPSAYIFTGSGMNVYGGLIVAYFAVWMYIRRMGLPDLHMMDIASPAVVLAYAVGRLGCQFSGDGDWGIPVGELNAAGEMVLTYPKPALLSWLPDWLWMYDYPHNVVQEGVPIADCVGKYCMKLSPMVFPTPIWETILSLLIFAVLWALRNRFKTAGMLFFFYLIFNGVQRFALEQIRVNEKHSFLGIQATQAEFIAAAFVLIGVIGFSRLWWKNSKSAL
jgi:phosphatidylglycerol---prolipoprotein diacylglyceryl transferase